MVRSCARAALPPSSLFISLEPYCDDSGVNPTFFEAAGAAASKEGEEVLGEKMDDDEDLLRRK